MSHQEFMHWIAFAQQEPLPEAREDVRAAMQMYLLASLHKGKKGKKLKLEHFLVNWWKDRRRADPRVLAAKFRALTEDAAEDGDPPIDSPSSIVTRG